VYQLHVAVYVVLESSFWYVVNCQFIVLSTKGSRLTHMMKSDGRTENWQQCWMSQFWLRHKTKFLITWCRLDVR